MYKKLIQTISILAVVFALTSCGDTSKTTDNIAKTKEETPVKKAEPSNTETPVKEIGKESLIVKKYNISKSDKINYAYSELMTLHDFSMTYSGPIKKEILKIDDIVNTVGQMNKPKGLALAKKMLKNLESAEDAMLDWMHNIKTDYSEMEEAQALAYLNLQKERIKTIGQNMNKAIVVAKANEQNIYQIDSKK